MSSELYPPSAQGVPADLTVPQPAYRRNVILVLLSLVVFMVFYAALIAASAYLIYYFLQLASPPPAEPGMPESLFNIWFAGCAAAALVILLFLVKGLFKWRRRSEETRIEITREDQPELFDFIQRICDETHAPFPLKIFLSSDVNAGVFYNSSILSLVMPVKKNLEIGLGLVNCLNLSEFKAVLAHEFGHFSQSSMRLGSYVYVANHVIYDLVFNRDGLDDLLAKARKTNIRIAIFAWAITGVLWVIRKLLEGAFMLINFVQSALSRQMEYHADLVAASITGSDSLLHGLKKLETGSACMQISMGDLQTAAEQKLFSRDLFYHQSRAERHLKHILREKFTPIDTALPFGPINTAQVFAPQTVEEKEAKERKWASHPSHFEREQNIKRTYIPSTEDQRSAWLLFRNPESLRRRLTESFYRNELEIKSSNSVSPEEVQRYIDDEHAESSQDERYHGLYDGRVMDLTEEDLTAATSDAELDAVSDDFISGTLKRMIDPDAEVRIKKHRVLHEERGRLRAMEDGDVKVGRSGFEFRGEKRAKSDLPTLAAALDAEIAETEKWLKSLDIDVLKAHAALERRAGGNVRDPLVDRYRCHLTIQQIVSEAQALEARMMSVYGWIASREGQLSSKDMSSAVKALLDGHAAAQTMLRRARTIALPPLRNTPLGLTIEKFICPEPIVDAFNDHTTISGDWMRMFGYQISQIETRARRLYFKSMGAILARQEELAKSEPRVLVATETHMNATDQRAARDLITSTDALGDPSIS